jgi:putative hydrolase of the HAD superfamily
MADLNHKKHLFFDLDDTLWDFEANSTLVLKDLFQEFDLKQKLNVESDQFLFEYYRINLELWRKLYKREIDKHYLRDHRFREVFQFFNYETQGEHLEISQRYLQRAPHGKALKPDCISTLEQLQTRHHLHIITNGFAETQSIKLDGCNLRQFFNHIIISEEHGFVKPEEGIFRLAENLSGAKQADCIMIGDNLDSDIAGAVNAGWQAIHFSESGDSSHNLQVKNLSELLRIF